MSATTTAGEVGAKPRQLTLQESLHCRSYGLDAVTEKDLNSHLLEPHKWPHAHAAGNENLHAVLGQVIDRGHAAALLMRNVGQGGNLQHFAFGDFHQGVKITVAEMGSERGIKSAGMV